MGLIFPAMVALILYYGAGIHSVGGLIMATVAIGIVVEWAVKWHGKAKE